MTQSAKYIAKLKYFVDKQYLLIQFSGDVTLLAEILKAILE